MHLFFNNVAKHWHFEELLRKSKSSRSKAAKWLRKFQHENLILKHCQKGKHPYYTANFEHPAYKFKKRIFSLQHLYQAGLLQYLEQQPDIVSCYLLGSFSGSDWHEQSDIDIFIYGKAESIDISQFQKKLRKKIQLFTAEHPKDLRKFSGNFLKNVIKGYPIKMEKELIEVLLREKLIAPFGVRKM